jgi:hypothetical protein
LIITRTESQVEDSGGIAAWTKASWAWWVLFSIGFPVYYFIQFVMMVRYLIKKITSYKAIHNFLTKPINFRR